MKYRIVKRFSHEETPYYVIQGKGVIFRWWSDLDVIDYNCFGKYFSLDEAVKDVQAMIHQDSLEKNEKVVWPSSS